MEIGESVSSARTRFEKEWLEIELVDGEGRPIAGEKYKVYLPDGSTREGKLDGNGRARVAGVDPGVAEVTFPDLSAADWWRS